MIEKNVAVVNAVPTTAIITKFCYGNDEIIAHFRDGSSKKFAQTDFELLTAETKKSQKNIRNGIDFVERKISNDFLRSIEIIDSPGLNALEKDHSNITQNFISQSDIIVWVFDANKLATKSEIDALKKILPSLKMKPIIVVNKIDELDEDEGDDLESILTEARKKLANSKIDFHSLIGISAELAFKGKSANNKNLIEESNIEKFYEVVDEILQNDFESYKRVELFDALSAFIFDFGNVLRKKYLDNANDISENYPAYIQNKKILAETEDNFNYLIDFVREYFDAHKLNFELRIVRKTFFGVLDWFTSEDKIYFPYDLEDAAVRNSETAKNILIKILESLGQKSKVDYWTGKSTVIEPKKISSEENIAKSSNAVNLNIFWENTNKNLTLYDVAKQYSEVAKKYSKKSYQVVQKYSDFLPTVFGTINVLYKNEKFFDLTFEFQFYNSKTSKWTKIDGDNHKQQYSQSCLLPKERNELKELKKLSFEFQYSPGADTESGLQLTRKHDEKIAPTKNVQSESKTVSIVTPNNDSRNFYIKGREREKVGDYYTAFSYYQTAAEHGNGLAMMAIANMYEVGNSVCKKSDTNALRWYKKAAETGYTDAKRKVAELEQKINSHTNISNKTNAWWMK